MIALSSEKIWPNIWGPTPDQKPKMSSDPVRVYAEDDARLPVRLSKVLQDRIASMSELVIAGHLSEGDYRSRTGHIAGLREALTECERIGKELSGS